MKTVVTTDPDRAAAFVRSGRLAAFPTETVYGLGADAFDARAVRRIFEAKGRPSDNPLIVHVDRPAHVDRLAREVPRAARALAEHFFPGPLTLVLPRAVGVPDVVTAGLDTVGVRMPDHPLALAFLAACGRPVAAPSANRSGRPSPTRWRAVLDDLDGRIDCLLRGRPTRVGVESTVVDLTGRTPIVLRPGGISLEALQAVVPATRPAAACDPSARSPGTRHRHYAPRARVVLVQEPAEARPAPDAAFIGLDPPEHPHRFALAVRCADVDDYARRLFAFFRESEARGVRCIYCQRVEPGGLGAALTDRLRRAAAATDDEARGPYGRPARPEP